MITETLHYLIYAIIYPTRQQQYLKIGSTHTFHYVAYIKYTC